MGNPYSVDLRERVVAFVEGGHSRRAAARQFHVGDSFAIQLQRVAQARASRLEKAGRTVAANSRPTPRS